MSYLELKIYETPSHFKRIHTTKLNPRPAGYHWQIDDAKLVRLPAHTKTKSREFILYTFVKFNFIDYNNYSQELVVMNSIIIFRAMICSDFFFTVETVETKRYWSSDVQQALQKKNIVNIPWYTYILQYFVLLYNIIPENTSNESIRPSLSP